MFNLFKNKIFWIISAAVIVLTAAVVVAVSVFWDKPGVPSSKVTFYGFSDKINISDYLPESNSESVEMPTSIGNNSNISYKFSNPDVDLGLQTEIYSELLRECERSASSSRPVIVAGEGESPDNHTVIRVFNEYQAKISQFLAFPVNVTGGVKVTGASVACGDENRSLIAAASYTGEFTETKSVRVFDEYGVLYMEIIPSFASRAPYNITAADFTGDGVEELLIMTESTDSLGNIDFALYSLSDGSVLLESELVFDEKYKDSETVISVRNMSGDSECAELIVFFDELSEAYLCNINFPGETVSYEKIDITISESTNGIYPSGYGENSYIFTLDKTSEVRSFIKYYREGELFGSTLNVGLYENTFFWSFNELESYISEEDLQKYEDSPYVKRATLINNDVVDSELYGLTYTAWEPVFNRGSHDENVSALRSYLSELFALYSENPEMLAALILASDIDIIDVSGSSEEQLVQRDSDINAMMAEYYREALLAGFPPEIISSSLPENYDLNCSPASAMLTFGTEFGTKRFGSWFEDDRTFIESTRTAGLRNITVSSYNSLCSDYDQAYKQLSLIASSGTKYTGFKHTESSDDGVLYDLSALTNLISINPVRPGYPGGTYGAVCIEQDGEKYNIIQIGAGESKIGLLKSVSEDGSWNGAVYLVPFHSHITTEIIDLSTNPRTGASSAVLGELNTGDVIDINFRGSYSGDGVAKMYIEVYEDGTLLENLTETFTLSAETTNYKYYISNQTALGNIKIFIRFECKNYNDVNIEYLTGSAQRESVSRPYYGDFTSSAHQGGVSFDILSREMICG